MTPVSTSLMRSAAGLAALLLVPAAQAVILTVNTSSGENVADNVLSFTEAVLVLNGAAGNTTYILGRNLTLTEQQQVSGVGSAPDEIRFAIPGAGPHFIAPPAGGFPHLFRGSTLLDGYSQTGAKPNSNPLLGTNNAVLKIVLDARTLGGINPDGETPDYTFKIKAPNVSFRGFSVLANRDTPNFGVDFASGAQGGQISGCWFGLSPDQAIFAGGEVAAAAYVTEGGHVFGTNGDGVNDRAEFNVIVAHAIGLQFELTKDIKVAGNFIGVLPNGVSVPAAAVLDGLEGDGIEGGDLTGTLTIGTNADGLADADEMNLFGGLKDDVIELYGDIETATFFGNYVGVGVDGTTALPPLNKFLRAQAGQFSVGAGPEAPVTAERVNRIENLTGTYLEYRNPEGYVALRGNSLRNNTGELFAGARKSLFAQLLDLPDATVAEISPVLDGNAAAGFIAGTVPLPTAAVPLAIPALVDLYLADPATVATVPQGATYLATFAEGSAADLDPLPGKFRFSLAGVPIPPGGSNVVVSTTIRSELAFDTSPFSNAAVALPDTTTPPVLTVALAGDEVVLTWPGTGFRLQGSTLLQPANWLPAGTVSPVRIPLAGKPGTTFYRLVTN